MPNGYTGNILRVNLSKGTMVIENPDELFYRTYFGGRNFIGHYLLRDCPRGCDPLGPDNKLIFALGVVTGAPVPGSGRHSVGAKSPLTGAYGEAEAGGYWGAELKRAGFDALVVEGCAPRPVYLAIQRGKVEILDAAHLWGKEVGEAEDIVREELRSRKIRTTFIGPAGENLVRFACVISDRSRAAGRTGLGAVMGAKRLKGIAVEGSKAPQVADKAALKEIARRVLDRRDEWKEFTDTGSAGILLPLNELGGLPTRHFQAGSFEGASEISGERMRDTILVNRPTCFACPICCKRSVALASAEKRWNVDPKYGGPEYETIAAFGSNCGISDLRAIAKANELCNRYSLDTISTGNVLSFAMECYERGLLTTKQTGQWVPRFGSAEALLEGVEMIAHRRGFGDWMAEGVARLATELRPEAETLALHVKGLEVPMHEPRIKHGLGLGYAVCPTGADHNASLHDTYFATDDGISRVRCQGVLQPLPVHDLTARKVRMFIYEVNWLAVDNCLLLCGNFFSVYSHDDRVAILRAVTGWDSNAVELAKVGERSITLARVYNVREGLGRAQDTLPARFFSPLDMSSTGVPLREAEFQDALTIYYSMMGWDTQGIPTRWKLQELGVEWVADELEKYRKRAEPC